MANLTFENKNEQKKTRSTFVSGDIALSDAINDVLFILPKASVVLDVFAITTTADTTTTATVDILVGETVVGNEVVVGAAGVGVASAVTQTFFETGGEVTMVTGEVAATGDGVTRIVVDYIEAELTNGQYTN
jgi:hypothetical protein